MRHRRSSNAIFITGTDTGVGKSVLTALLLNHLRSRGCKALAIKPFCSGSLDDAKLLYALQDSALPLEKITPFYFPDPVAPLASSRLGGPVPMEAARKAVEGLATTAECLLIEGAGGLLVPLGPGYTIADLICALNCAKIIVVAPNRLGTINHSLLSLNYLERMGVSPQRLRLVLMEPRTIDASVHSNALLIRKFAPGVAVLSVPYLGPNASTPAAVKKNGKKIEKTLAALLH